MNNKPRHGEHCPRIGDTCQCINGICAYDYMKGDKTISELEGTAPEQPKDYTEHLYMKGDADIPQLGSSECRDYFQLPDNSSGNN